jgi:hypothetical protein
MTSISAIIWGESDRLARREGGFYVTTGQVVYQPVMNAEARADVKRAKERAKAQTIPPVDTYTPEQERRAADLYKRAMARSKRNAYGLGE